jgi:pimeloyl-ACP methyl ester carboxylesterase
VLAVCQDIERPIHLVGHSFGGSVALKAAAALGPRAGRIVLFEPNPFYLLKQHGRTEAYAEARALRDYVKQFGAAGEWQRVAERFADYWVGDGAWAAMPEKRRAAFTASLAPNFHEWDSMDQETTGVEAWDRVAAEALVLRAMDTRRSVREIFDVFREHCPRWSFKEIPAGGHMAPLTHPEAVNPVIGRFLDTGRAD